MEQHHPRILIVGEIAAPIRDCLATSNCELVEFPDLTVALRQSEPHSPTCAIIAHPSSLPAPTDPATQQKLDALYKAGSELAGLDADHLSDLDVDSRIELLKQNLRRSVHDLLRYDVIEIRLLERSTGELMPLLAEGMTDEAQNRSLFAEPEGNGVTGFVAATGNSYLCPDTTADPRYLQGAHGARSSLTVPLMVQGEVIGTLNVESPNANAFSADDLRFTELFASQVAQALHTLRLLSAQQDFTAAQSVDSIIREVSLPFDELLVTVGSLLARSTGEDPERDAMLRSILGQVRSVRERVRDLGGEIAPSIPYRTGKGYDTTSLQGMQILVVDHDERTRRAAHSLLSRYGCLVETAGTGLAGVALAQTRPYDAILADIRLPDLGGYDTYRRLREARPESRVILMTVFGYDSAHSIVKARQDGMRFVLLKPFRLDQVLDTLLAPDHPDGAVPSHLSTHLG